MLPLLVLEPLVPLDVSLDELPPLAPLEPVEVAAVLELEPDAPVVVAVVVVLTLPVLVGDPVAEVTALVPPLVGATLLEPLEDAEPSDTGPLGSVDPHATPQTAKLAKSVQSTVPKRLVIAIDCKCPVPVTTDFPISVRCALSSQRSHQVRLFPGEGRSQSRGSKSFAPGCAPIHMSTDVAPVRVVQTGDKA